MSKVKEALDVVEEARREIILSAARRLFAEKDFRSVTVREIARKYPYAGYGGLFYRWLHSDDPRPYNSWGNGSAMRISPVAFAFNTAEVVLREAVRRAEITHNHPEGVKGAQATALAVFLARTTRDKYLIRARVSGQFGYDLDRKLEDIRPSYRFDVSCQGTVPEAIIAFLESDSFEDAVRNGASLVPQARVKKVLLENGQAAGVEYSVRGSTRRVIAPTVVLAAGEGEVELSGGGPRFRFRELVVDDFPALPEPALQEAVEIDGDAFLAAAQSSKNEKLRTFGEALWSADDADLYVDAKSGYPVAFRGNYSGSFAPIKFEGDFGVQLELTGANTNAPVDLPAACNKPISQ